MRRFALVAFLCLAVHGGARAQSVVWTRFTGAADAYRVGVAVDPAGNAYLAGAAKALDGHKVGDSACLRYLVKYDAQGKKLWTKILADLAFHRVQGVIAGADGVYVFGESGSPVVVKFDPTGTQKWEARTKQGSEYKGLALDRAGNAYAVGYSGFPDRLVLLEKFAPDGTLIWSNTYGLGEATSVAVDRQGDVYLAGYKYDRSNNFEILNFYLMKCNPGGEVLWRRPYGDHRRNWGSYVAVGPDGDVNAVRYSEGDYANTNLEGAYDLTLLKFSKKGELLRKTDGGITFLHIDDDQFLASGDGGFYATLYPDPASGKTRQGGSRILQPYLARYGKDGELVWSGPFGGVELGVGDGVALDAKGFLYAAGTQAAPQADSFVVKLAVPPASPAPPRFVVKRPAPRPSFTCDNAASAQEKLICGSPVLAQLDRAIAQLYAMALKIGRPGVKWRSEQSAWLKGERSRYTTADELEICIKARIQTLRKQLGLE